MEQPGERFGDTKLLRRDFLKTSAALLYRGSSVRYYGYLPPILPSPIPSLFNTYPELEGSGAGKIVLLYKYIEKILGKSLPAFLQQGPDCTSMAGGMSLDIIQATQNILHKSCWEGRVATEYLHIGGRQIVGKRYKGGISIESLMTFIVRHGTVFRKKYKFENQVHDFTKYNYTTTTNRLSKDFPSWLLQEGRKHRVDKVVKISTWDEAVAAIRNLSPVVIGSSVGFDGVSKYSGAKRDKDGFTKPKGKWYHAWSLIGVDDKSKRPGGCLMNSHGEHWVKGPIRHKQPNGSIWVDKDVLNKMLAQYGDSYAICTFQGCKPKKYKLW